MTDALARRTPSRRLCLDCRTWLDDAAAEGSTGCDRGPAHRVVDLGSEAGRARWMNTVWGPPDRRQQARVLAAASGSGAGFGLMFEGCMADGCGSLATEPAALLVVAAFAAVFGAVWWIVSLIYRRIQAHRHRLRPRGAPIALMDTPEESIRGKVGVGGAIDAGASSAPCRAFAVELRQEDANPSPRMLGQARSAGFEVAVEDGTVIEIAAGRIRLDAPMTRIEGDHTRALAHELETLVSGVGDEHHAALPWDAVWEARLVEGDEVTVYGPFELVDTEQRADTYRQGAIKRLAPIGVPRLARESPPGGRPV